MHEHVNPSAFFRAFDLAFFVPGFVLFAAILSFGIFPCYQSASRTYYEVLESDDLYSISSSYNLSPPALKRINGLEDDKVFVGQKLLVCEGDLMRRFFTVDTGGFSLHSLLQGLIYLVGVYLCGLAVHGLSWPLNRRLSARFEGLIWMKKFWPNMETSCEVSKNEQGRIWFDKQRLSELSSYFWYLRSTCLNGAVAMLIGAVLMVIYSMGGCWFNVYLAFATIFGGLIAGYHEFSFGKAEKESELNHVLNQSNSIDISASKRDFEADVGELPEG